MPSNPYLYSNFDCLKNKLGYTDPNKLAKAEKHISSLRTAKLAISPLTEQPDYNYFKAIHRYVFGGIYEWAGQERNIQTERSGYRFEWPEKIKSTAEKHFSDLAKENYLKDLKRPEFIERSAYYFAEINVVHPFPDGNGRCQRILFDRIAQDAGFQFQWGDVPREPFIDAVIHSFAIDTSKLEVVFDRTLRAVNP